MLGSTKGLNYKELITATTEQTHNLDMTDGKGKKAGNVVFKTLYTWAEPDPPKVKRDPKKQINKKCTLTIKIIDATFLKDADTFGKQDPYMKFEYGRGALETTVKDDAGKYALWNEQFVLHGVNREVEANKGLILEAYEKDVASSDFLGRIKEISWKELTDWEGLVKHNVDLLDDKGTKSGSCKFSTSFKWVEYIPPTPSKLLDKKSYMRIIIKSATFLKDADMVGKQDPYIKFEYEGKSLKTDVKDDAGKAAEWNETF